MSITIIKEEFNKDLDIIEKEYVYRNYREAIEHDFSIFLEQTYSKMQVNEYIYGYKFEKYLEAILEGIGLESIEDLESIEEYNELLNELKDNF